MSQCLCRVTLGERKKRQWHRILYHYSLKNVERILFIAKRHFFRILLSCLSAPLTPTSCFLPELPGYATFHSQHVLASPPPSSFCACFLPSVKAQEDMQVPMVGRVQYSDLLFSCSQVIW